METIFQILIILTAIAGLIVSYYVRRKKQKSLNQMACPMDGSCEKVVSSEYSKFLGFPVEIMGMIYYIVVAAAYIIYLIAPFQAPTWFVFGVLMASMAAVLFSAYLTFIQAFALKMWCTLCLISAAFCGLIMLFSVPASTIGLTALLAEFQLLLYLGLLFGVAVGLGASVIGDFFLLKFIQDFEITEQQADTIKSMYHLIWFGLAFVVVSGISLYLAESEYLISDGELILASAATGIIILNNSFLNYYVAPNLEDFAFLKEEVTQKIEHARKAAFSMSCISIVSWLALFILVIVGSPYTFEITGMIYGLALIAALFAGLALDIFENYRANSF